MPHILFVCTGNVFRSLSAMFAMSAAADPSQDYTFSSAGTHARKGHRLREDVKARMAHWGTDPSVHKPRRVTKEILEGADLIVVMGTDHQDFLKKKFNVQSTLFTTICDDKNEHIPDLCEEVTDFKNNKEAAKEYVDQTIDRIFQSRDQFLKRLPLFLSQN